MICIETAVICKDSGLLAGEYCPESSKVKKTYVKDASGEDAMPTKVCDVHTSHGLLQPLIDALTTESQWTGCPDIF
ncbi:MAG: hypothetical protein ACLUD0_20385 [Eubacterium ramulus]